MAFAVARDPGGLGQVHDTIGFRDEGGFDCGRGPREGAGRALGAEGLTELLAFGADVSDCLVNGVAIRAQKNTPPKESVLFGGCCACGDYAPTGRGKSRPGAAGSVIRCAHRLHDALCGEPDATRNKEAR